MTTREIMELALQALQVTADESARGTRTQAALRAKAKRALRRALTEGVARLNPPRGGFSIPTEHPNDPWNKPA